MITNEKKEEEISHRRKKTTTTNSLFAKFENENKEYLMMNSKNEWKEKEKLARTHHFSHVFFFLSGYEFLIIFLSLK